MPGSKAIPGCAGFTRARGAVQRAGETAAVSPARRPTPQAAPRPAGVASPDRYREGLDSPHPAPSPPTHPPTASSTRLRRLRARRGAREECPLATLEPLRDTSLETCPATFYLFDFKNIRPLTLAPDERRSPGYLTPPHGGLPGGGAAWSSPWAGGWGVVGGTSRMRGPAPDPATRPRPGTKCLARAIGGRWKLPQLQPPADRSRERRQGRRGRGWPPPPFFRARTRGTAP